MTSIANKAKAGILDVNQVNSFVNSCKDYFTWMSNDLAEKYECRDAAFMLDFYFKKNGNGDYCYQMQFENLSLMTKLLFEIQAGADIDEIFVPSTEQCANVDCCVAESATLLGDLYPSFQNTVAAINRCPVSVSTSCPSRPFSLEPICLPANRTNIVSSECKLNDFKVNQSKNASVVYNAAVNLCSSCSNQYISQALTLKQYSFSSGCNRTSERYQWVCQKSKEVNGEYCLADFVNFYHSETYKNLANSSYTLSEQDCLSISCCVYSFYKMFGDNPFLSRFDECKVPISKTCASLTYRIRTQSPTNSPTSTPVPTDMSPTSTPVPTNSQNLASNSSDYTKWYAIGGGVGGSVIVLSAVFAIRSHRKKSRKNVNTDASTYALQLQNNQNRNSKEKEQFSAL
jgi:hypothetical protein